MEQRAAIKFHFKSGKIATYKIMQITYKNDCLTRSKVFLRCQDQKSDQIKNEGDVDRSFQFIKDQPSRIRSARPNRWWSVVLLWRNRSPFKANLPGQIRFVSIGESGSCWTILPRRVPRWLDFYLKNRLPWPRTYRTRRLSSLFHENGPQRNSFWEYEEAIQSRVITILNTIPREVLFQRLYERCQACVEREGQGIYIENSKNKILSICKI